VARAEYKPDVAASSGEALRVYNDLRAALRELKLESSEGGNREISLEFSPSASYSPVRVRFAFLERSGVLSAMGQLFPLQSQPGDEFGTALNFLNQELALYAFYVAGGQQGPEVVVRQDLLPNLRQGAAVHPKEVLQTLTGLCTQKQIFAGPLQRVAEGGSWRFVRDALKAVR
jgi:hypothetical protein